MACMSLRVCVSGLTAHIVPLTTAHLWIFLVLFKCTWVDNDVTHNFWRTESPIFFFKKRENKKSCASGGEIQDEVTETERIKASVDAGPTVLSRQESARARARAGGGCYVVSARSWLCGLAQWQMDRWRWFEDWRKTSLSKTRGKYFPQRLKWEKRASTDRGRRPRWAQSILGPILIPIINTDVRETITY